MEQIQFNHLVLLLITAKSHNNLSINNRELITIAKIVLQRDLTFEETSRILTAIN
jgi:hypothetical protein